MRNVPEHELFSAYLDGELTAEEQTEMDRLLATSPAARQLLEELKTLSSTLQSLPVHKLDEDLSERVLRMAERQMLSGSSEPPRPNDALQAVSVAPGWQPILRRLMRPRTLFWPAAAVAIALLIMAFDRGGDRRPPAEKVAMAPPAAVERQPVEPPTVRAAPPASGGMEERVREGKPLAEQPATGHDDAARRSVAEKEAKPGLAAEKASIATTERKGDTAEGDKASTSLASSAPPADRPAAKPAPVPSSLARDHLAEMPAAPAAPPAMKTPAPYGAKPKGQPEAKPAADSIAGSSSAKGDALGAGMGGAGAGAASRPMKAGRAATAKRPSQPEFLNGNFSAGKVAGVPVLVVRCDVSAEAAARGILHQVFARDESLQEKKSAARGKEGSRGAVAGFGAMDASRQQVQVVEEARAAQETQVPVARKAAQKAQEDAGIPAEPAAVMPQKPVAVVQRERRATVSKVYGKAEKSQAEVYLEFDATPDQVQAALAELKARPDVFSFLAVESSRESLKDASPTGPDGEGGGQQPGESRASQLRLPAKPQPASRPAPPAAQEQEAKPGPELAKQSDQKRSFEAADRVEERRRVRFVLRVVPSRAPIAADVAVEKAAEQAGKAAKMPAARFEARPPAAEAAVAPAAAAPAAAPPAAK